ncbi:MAG: DUF3631 domain-containing protein [Candidatus Binataceae bacterium]
MEQGLTVQQMPAKLHNEQARAKVEAEISRLAGLDMLDYQRQRKAAAKELKITVTALDKFVSERRPRTSGGGAVVQGQGLNLKNPEPWPEPVQGMILLDNLAATFERFVVLPHRAADALAMWVVFAHALDCFDIAPRLALLSPTMRAGKTTLLRVLAHLVPRALLASNVSPAALFRVIEAAKPTLLIDEADTFTRDNRELHGILNSGHTRDAAFVARCHGEENEPRRFSTWAAIAVAAIGTLPSTWLDRSLLIDLKRKRADEHIERLTRAELPALAELARKAVRWALDNRTALEKANPAIPAGLDDRAADNWRPLFAIADLAGKDWSERTRIAALALSGHRDDSNHSSTVKLLADIKTIFDTDNSESIGSTELCNKLVELELSPWATVSKGRPLTPAKLARLLKPYNVFVKKQARINCYVAGDFADAFARYLADPTDQSSMVRQTLGAVRGNSLPEVPSEKSNGTFKKENSSTGTRTDGTMELPTQERQFEEEEGDQF